MRVVLLLAIFVSFALADLSSEDESTKAPEEDLLKMDEIINKAAVRDRKLLWPNGQVPYVLSNSYNKKQRRLIAEAMEEFRKYTCIRFVPRTNQRNYINIKKRDGCSSYVGMRGGEQIVSLGDGCVRQKVTPMHELMHAIGFKHEQARLDREYFVNVNTKNIEQRHRHNFKIADPNHFQLLTPYDYNSVMHYGSSEFGIDGKTVLTRKDGSKKFSNKKGFSELDIVKVNLLYNCRRSG